MNHAQVFEYTQHSCGGVQSAKCNGGGRLKAVQAPLDEVIDGSRTVSQLRRPPAFFGEQPSLFDCTGLQPGLGRGLVAPTGPDL